MPLHLALHNLPFEGEVIRGIFTYSNVKARGSFLYLKKSFTGLHKGRTTKY